MSVRTSVHMNGTAYNCECTPKRGRPSKAQLRARDVAVWVELLKLYGAPFSIEAHEARDAIAACYARGLSGAGGAFWAFLTNKG